METLLILASAAVAVLALAYVWATSVRERRPPLRTRQEEEMVGGDPDGLVATMRPASPSPIDRDAPILEISAIEAALAENRFLDGRAGEVRMIEGRVIEGPVIEGRVLEDAPAADGHEDEAKARAWNAADEDRPAEPGAAAKGRTSR